jgi:glycosyltransferase involved in cell wall biosynthesis
VNSIPPLFSIIIPTYNRAHLLKIAIQSVSDQTFEDWEIVVVDDGSVDETKEVVSAFSEEKVRYVFQQNQELSAARNTGIRNSRGTYICFLDDDDYYLPEHLFHLSKVILKQNKPIAFFRSGTLQKVRENLRKLPNYAVDDNLTPIQFVWYNPVNLLSIAIHKDVFQQFFFAEKFRLFEDAHFLMRALLVFPFFQIEPYTVVYVSHQDMRSIAYFKDDKKAEEELACLLDLFATHGEALSAHITPKMQQEGIAFHYLGRTNKAFFERKFKKGLGFFWKAIKTRISFKMSNSYAYTFALFWSKLVFNYPKPKDLGKE